MFQVLWAEEREETKQTNKQSFVDFGCGNGLLTHILISEGVSIWWFWIVYVVFDSYIQVQGFEYFCELDFYTEPLFRLIKYKGLRNSPKFLLYLFHIQVLSFFEYFNKFGLVFFRQKKTFPKDFQSVLKSFREATIPGKFLGGPRIVKKYLGKIGKSVLENSFFGNLAL